MTTTSKTGYTFLDTLPRDAGGQKFLALGRSESSAGGFLMVKGIAGSNVGTIQYGHLAVGTHVQASKVEAGHPGLQLGGVYLQSLQASKNEVNSGQFRLAGATQHGEIFVSGACMIGSLLSTSVNTIAGSGLLMGVNVIFHSESSMTISNGDQTIFRMEASAPHVPRTDFYEFTRGIWYGNDLKCDISDPTNCSMIIYLKQ